MTCDQFTELVDLYAVGSLEKAEAEALKTHLESGCKGCNTRLDEALVQAALISSTVPVLEPPPSLRDRIAASVNAAKPVVVMPPRKAERHWAPWLIAAAAMLAMIVGIGYEENARRIEVASVMAEVKQAQNENAQRTAAMLSILQAPGTKQVMFDINQSNSPHGSFFIHKNLGVAMVVAHLPSAPEGWKYESWIVPKSGAPKPVESFSTDNTGFAFTVVKGPVDVSQWSGMAVSMEPENSTPVKPTKLVFNSPV